ncbi:Zn-ribbon domain-containing OB-fold protein [Mycolicibacterium confluentis]|uniref:Acyl dehydratase n=1 Tax=Mycolicibacterium confluentis TaxID=28047 RepID=A0A7I7XYE7_9MYCO|nr:OB-fold domain-containing protein [Mycolicibacterium confluentis]MCV7317769.1 OB-fold domain-containing protein [Mycolicibacterium confluentis]ORV28169.1 acyl dehydratase [Mycolicibacterium confluentis]BBZ34184.1 acyl dehydratase [Mycolicibacterium confluentis]
MTALERPMPLPTPVSQPYWDGLRRHEVWIQYSPSLGRYVFYPRVLAPGTLADDLEWRQISGAGTLVSFAVAERPVAPQFADAVPHLLAIVEWHEGPRFATELVDVAPEELEVGMPVTPVFVDVLDHDVTLLKYAPRR